MAVGKNPMEKLLALAAEFVMKQQGTWAHEDWESFVAAAEKTGYSFDDEGKRNLGNILEALKFFYFQMPAEVKVSNPKKKAAAR
ncbi:MAG TPA: hypothetical protein PKY35_05245 [Candidatus Hydrogenedentes bacterium]|nr:hypothetical protein [Candidatus Hydrogenedentota bacterium]HOL76417.1 hypothetical protein [Candidatus Hydrogenedentota bacterium]HPO85455.1 hypothetical protein [Candidatus Hydrogenedentota bacterium]